MPEEIREECYRGMIRGGFARDECCCICKNHYPLMSHPWVDGKSILNQIGWICLLPVTEEIAMLSNEHGVCEMFDKK